MLSKMLVSRQSRPKSKFSSLKTPAVCLNMFSFTGTAKFWNRTATVTEQLKKKKKKVEVNESD